MGRCAAGWVLAAAAAIAASATGGCAGGETKTVTVGAATAAATTSTATAPAPPGQADRALATRRGTVDDSRARLDITELRRSGRTAALTVRITNVSPTESTDFIYIQDELGDGIADSTIGNEGAAFDGPSLVDTKNAKRYRVARDSTGACVCDTNLGTNTSIRPGQSLTLSATFGAPPPDVGAVDVHIPRFGTIKDVPIS